MPLAPWDRIVFGIQAALVTYMVAERYAGIPQCCRQVTLLPATLRAGRQIFCGCALYVLVGTWGCASGRGQVLAAATGCHSLCAAVSLPAVFLKVGFTEGYLGSHQSVSIVLLAKSVIKKVVRVFKRMVGIPKLVILCSGLLPFLKNGRRIIKSSFQY
jgi:hypothetical protein